MIVTVGGGIRAFPRYPGADGQAFLPKLILNVRREDRPVSFRAPDQNFGISVLKAGSAVRLGPVVDFQTSRNEVDVGAPVGNVGWTAELGAFAEGYVSKILRVRSELRKGLNGHGGMVADLSADMFFRSGNSTVFSIGPRLRWADDNYTAAYYGVTPEVSAATGLDPFDPGSGIQSLGVTAGMRLAVSQRISLHGYARHDFLMNNSAASPIVRQFGSRDQLSASLGISYNFVVRPPPLPAPQQR
jgi:outer membrane protein